MEYIEVYSMLNEDNSQEIQDKGIKLAQGMKDIDKFILPMHPLYNKNIWENCAKIIAQKSDWELEPYLMELLTWLQDLNWPGTFIIIDRLKRFSGQLLLEPYIKTMFLAFEKDNDNQEWGDFLSVLIENKELAIRLDKGLYAQIKRRYDNFWI